MYKNILFGTLAFLISAQGHSAMVTIVNPSFEEGAIFGDPPGWESWSENSGTSFSVGTYPPTSVNDFYNPGSIPVPPDGIDVGWVFVGSNQSQGGGKVGFHQTLEAVLMPNSHYELSVAVGNLQSAKSPRGEMNSFNFYGFPGYEIQLLAGGDVLESDENSITINEGDFGIASLSFNTGDSHALLGEALGIRLINLNEDLRDDEANNCVGEFCDLPWDSEVDFDNVSLSVSAVPVPAAFWLFGTALVGFVGISRRRKVA